MDDYPNEPAQIHSLSRKRKADGDECQDPSSSSDGPSADNLLRCPSATPRIPAEPAEHPPPPAWLIRSQRERDMIPSWQQPVTSSSPHAGPSRPKRPRIEIPTELVPLRKLRKGRAPFSGVSPFRRSGRAARSGDVRTNGIVSATEPRTSRGPLLHLGIYPPSRHSQSAPASPVDPVSPHIPPHQPPINRDTLKELDLEAILRNPQLRHDLLFDSGLQFRPTSSRRKRDMADNYWLAIVRELETGCTCTTIDPHGKLLEPRCICQTVPLPTDKSIRAFSCMGDFMSVRVPSRMKALLSELLEVLISIIQPVVSRSTGLCMHPGLLQPQYQQNAAHVSHLRSILDGDLIQQEVDHGLFDPSGVFESIGDIIRCYCAPMRDPAVDQMVALAQSCRPGGTGTKADAVRAIRLCFEIMELMKLDVANHQLQTLRPYLNHSAAVFELKTFQESRQKGKLSLSIAQQWLQAAYQDMITHTPSPSKHTRQMQIHIAVTKAVVNLVFNPPPPASSPSSPSSPSRVTPSTLPGYPETLYLDHTRLSSLSTDAADFTALYILLMLYRQMLQSASRNSSRINVKLEELVTLKKEIWEIGPAHLGYCFMPASRKETGSGDAPDCREKTAERKKWEDELSDVVLQLSTRATDAHSRSSIPPRSIPSDGTDHTPLHSVAPDPALLKLATSWTESHLQHGSLLSDMLRKRVHKVAEEITVQLVLSAMTPGSQPPAAPVQDAGATSGLEPLMPEIHHLAERLTKLISIHMNVYGALYAQPGFLTD